MSKRINIDTYTRFSNIAYKSLPDYREIENPEIELVPKNNPLKKEILKDPYLPNKKLAEAVDLAITLSIPLLLQYKPGCGKMTRANMEIHTLSLLSEVSYSSLMICEDE